MIIDYKFKFDGWENLNNTYWRSQCIYITVIWIHNNAMLIEISCMINQASEKNSKEP
jgi:hypothetical protein